MIPITLITHAVAAMAAAAAAWTWQANAYTAKIATLKTEYAQAQARAVEKAHAETIRLQDQADDAQRKAGIRQAALARDAAGARDALVRLSDAANSALRDAQESHGTCTARAATLADVFKGCTGQLQHVAGEADRLASDKQTLIEAWPH